MWTIWLGDLDDARFSEKYDVVINCTPDLPFFNNESENIRISLLDKDFENETTKLKKSILQTIDNRLTFGKRILIHCGAGQSRSPTIVACYLLYNDHTLSVEDVVKLLRIKHSNAFFGRVSFKDVLEYVRIATCI